MLWPSLSYKRALEDKTLDFELYISMLYGKQTAVPTSFNTRPVASI